MAAQDKTGDVKLLLSPNSIKYLVWAVKMCTWIGAVPYTYDDKTKKFLFDDSRRMRIIWWSHNIVYNFYMTYVGLRWIENTARYGSKSPGAMGSLYVALNYQIANAVQISVGYSYGSHQKWLNMFFEYIEDLQVSQGHNLRTSRFVSNDCGPLLRVFFLSCVIIFILDTYSVFLTPHQPFFFSSVVPEPQKMNFWQLLPFAIFHDYIWIYQWFVVLFYYTTIICYLTGIQNALEALRCTIVLQKAERITSAQIPIQGSARGQAVNRRQSQVPPAEHESRTSAMQIVKRQGNANDGAEDIVLSILGAVEILDGENGIRKAAQKMKQRQRPSSAYALIGQNPTQFSKQYRTMEILQNFCNKTWGTCNACYEVAFICGSVLGFYNAVTLERDRAFHQFAVGMFFTYTLMMIWQQMGNIFEQSSEVLWSWRFGNVGRPFFRRFMKSARPIRTTIGGFFYADRGIRLTILAIIFERTSSLLLSD